MAAVRGLDDAVAAVRERDRDLRWIPSERWHLTLAFLGEVDESALAPLSERLGRVARRHQPLSLRFAGAGRFGSRVLWAGVSGDREDLRHLAASVAAAARRAGVPVDGRAHRPHVTLARSRTTSLDLRPMVQALADHEGREWLAESFSLVRSYLGAQPRYEALHTWPLEGRQAGSG